MLPGTRIGPFEVIAPIGSGGMGEVYRARDIKLDREVALKVLPALFANDPERLSRFRREAHLLASLNHVHIARVHGFEDSNGVHALVMELIDGPTLADRLAGGPLPFDEAVAIARQIAEALEAAHEKGIIHRDLKPANIKIDNDGAVKVLDFGLAKALDPTSAASMDALNSPTLTARSTQLGVILGTAAYMAPEQARGRAADKRADIWAFGVVFYEMLTGRRAFDGEEVSDVMASVLRQDIDWSALPPTTPSAIHRLLRRCLERDPKQRLRDIGEARITLGSPVDEPAAPASDRGDGRSVSRWALPGTWLAWAIAVAAVLTALVVASSPRTRATPRAPERLLLEIGPPTDLELIVASNAGAVVISPDGTSVAFLAQTPAGRRLYVRSLATGETRALPGTAEVQYPFWSPDSRSIGFFGSSKLFTIAVASGQPEAIAPIEDARGGTWSSDGVILFTPRGGGEVHRVPARGGTVERVTTLDPARGENAHYWPVALPGSKKFLFFIRSTQPENNGIYLGSPDGTKVRLVTSLSSGLYMPPHESVPGSLLWVRDDDLLAQPLDIDAGRLTGEVSTIASDVRVEESQRGTFASVSDNGRIVWASARAAKMSLAWYERNGRRIGDLPVEPGKIMQPRISPDGTKLAFTRASNGTADVWVHDFSSGVTTQVTTDPDYDESPSWSPDGRQLVYQGNVKAKQSLLIAAVDGSKDPTPIAMDEPAFGGRFMSDGRAVVFSVPKPSTGSDLQIASVERPDLRSDLTSDPGQEVEPEPSPDGRWLTYMSDRTGRFEIVLARLIRDGMTFRLGQRVPVTSTGGMDPIWRKDGREIAYLAPDGTLMAVSVTIAGEGVTLGKPTPMFRLRSDAGGWGATWTATGDLTKFVIVEAPHAIGQRFQLLTNWMPGK